MYIFYFVGSLIALTEVVLVTPSDKKEIKGKYWGKFFRIRVTWRDNCKAWMKNMKNEDRVRMVQCIG